MTEAIAKVTACVGRKTKFASDLLVFSRTKLMHTSNTDTQTCVVVVMNSDVS